MSDVLAVTICATKKYQYAMVAQARTIHANLRHVEHPIVIVLVGDSGLKEIEDLYKALFKGKTNVSFERRAGFEANAGDLNYKNGAQLLIAQMRSEAFAVARTAGATLCWSFDSDVIPKTACCYRTLKWILDMPGSFYEVAISPYPSQGGGDLLAGRGTPEHPIMQDFRPEERAIPPELQKRIDDNKAAIAKLKPGEQPAKEIIEEATELNKKIDECQPIGNVFQVNAKSGWKMRGWLSQAYPALGRGVIVPTDWCGFGNTLLGRRPLDECEFAGYEGAGTEDLFVVWHRWHQIGIRIGAALHEPSSHVSRRGDGKYFMSYPRFVTEADETKGECVGHLRIMQRPFYQHEKGEKFDAMNDGNPIAPADRPKVVPAAVPAPSPGKPAEPPAPPQAAEDGAPSPQSPVPAADKAALPALETPPVPPAAAAPAEEVKKPDDKPSA